MLPVVTQANLPAGAFVCPYVLSPQHWTESSERSTQTWFEPTAMSITLRSHDGPLKPGRHEHTALPALSMQTAPFSQGLGSHASTSSHSVGSPERSSNPASQVQRAVPLADTLHSP